MPIVPVSGGPSVAPAQIASPRSSVEGFGGGQAARPFDVSGAAQVAEKVYQDQRVKANQIAVVDAGARTSAAETTLLRDPQHGLLNLRGRDALGAIDQARAGWAKHVEGIEQTLTNDDQKLAFRRIAADHWASIDEQIQHHMAVEGERYDAQATAAYVDNEDARAQASYRDPKIVETAIGNRVAAIKDFGARNGLAPDVIAQQVAQATSKTRFGVVEQLLNNEQDIVATDYFTQHRADFLGKDLTDAERLTGAGSIRGESRRHADEITTTATTLADAMRRIDDITDPRIADATERRVRQFYADQSADQRQQAAGAFQRARAVLEDTKDLDKIPRADWLQLNESDARYLEFRENMLRHPKIATNVDVYTSLLNGAGLNAATRQHFEQLDLTQYRDQLSDADYKSLVNKQLTMRLGTEGRATADERHDKYAGESEARRKQHQAEADARAAAKKAAAAAALRKQAEAMGIHLPPSVPGAPLPARPTPAKPGAGTPGGINLSKPAPSDTIAKLNIPDTWKDEAAVNSDYADYLEHHAEAVA